jgi:hypothetical protein
MGQMIAVQPTTYIAVFRSAYPAESRPDLKAIVKDEIFLLARAGDGPIARGEWEVVGNIAPDLTRIPFPCFKTSVGSADNMYVLSFDGTKRRPALPNEIEQLPNRTLYSGIALQSALQAEHGVGNWEARFRGLTYEYAKSIADICQL